MTTKFRPFEIGDRVRVIRSGATGTIVGVPGPRAVDQWGMAGAQHHVGVRIRWDAEFIKFGVGESIKTVCGNFERIESES